MFFNLEHVTPGSPTLHSQYLAAIGLSPGDEDPSNQLAPVETQLRWLREIGFVNVDCYWTWLELALLGGTKSGPLSRTRASPQSKALVLRSSDPKAKTARANPRKETR